MTGSRRTLAGRLVGGAVSSVVACLALTTVISTMRVTGCSAYVDKDVVYYLDAALYYVGPMMAAVLVFAAIVVSRPGDRRSGWRYAGASFGAIGTLIAAGLVTVPVLFFQAAMAGCFQ